MSIEVTKNKNYWQQVTGMKDLRMRIRLDFRGVGKRRLLVGSRNSQQAAEDIREHRVSQLLNLPVQGIKIEQVDMQHDTYTLYDERGVEEAYAPAVFTVRADGLEDALRFLFQDEFRKIELLEPTEMIIDRHQMERFLFKIGERMKEVRSVWERRFAGR